MAKITKLSITLVRKISDGNYGTYGAEVTVEAQLEDGDDVKDVKSNLRKSALKDLERAIEVITPEEPQAKKKK